MPEERPRECCGKRRNTFERGRSDKVRVTENPKDSFELAKRQAKYTAHDKQQRVVESTATDARSRGGQ